MCHTAKTYNEAVELCDSIPITGNGHRLLFHSILKYIFFFEVVSMVKDILYVLLINYISIYVVLIEKIVVIMMLKYGPEVLKVTFLNDF